MCEFVPTETSPESQHQRSSEVHSKKTVLIKTIETRDGEVWAHTYMHTQAYTQIYTFMHKNVHVEVP